MYPPRSLPPGIRSFAIAPATVAAVLILSGCGGEPPAPEPLPPWQEAGEHRWRELRVGGSGPGFTPLEADHTGLEIPYDPSEDALMDNRILAQGSGVAAGDVDGDGRPDLYFTRPTRANGLFLNRGGMRFVEVTDEAGVALEDHVSTGVAMEDMDGDGDLDLVVGGLGDPTRLLLNDGTGVFTDASESWGLTGSHPTTTLAIADVDGNGTLDLYLVNNKLKSVQDLYPPEEIAFDSVVRRVGDEFEILPEYREHYRLSREGNRLERFEVATPDYFYLNRGDAFRGEALTDGRFLDSDGEPVTDAPRDWGLAGRFRDMDRDGDPDLYVCNDFQSPDRIWMNQGDGTFRAIDPLALRATSFSCMAIGFSDVDGDGGTEIFTSDMRSREGPPRRLRNRRMYPDRPSSGEPRVTVQENYNTLNWRRADGTWSEIGRHAGVTSTDWTWGVSFVDADLDGREDIFVVNGHAWDLLHGDLQRRISSDTSDVDWRRRLSHYPRLERRNVAFRALPGELRFEEMSREWSFGLEEDVSHGLAPADLDGDGDLDLVVTTLESEPRIFRNEAKASRVAVRLAGRPPNTGAVGARVEVRGPGLPAQSREVGAAGLYYADAGPTLSFAAGEADSLAVSVRWPDGGCTVLPVVSGRLYEIRQPSAATDTAAGASGRDACPAPGLNPGGPDTAPPPLFEDRTDRLDHTHEDRPFPDFDRQPLVPYRLSELGPGVSWQDLDGNGWPELVVPSGRGGEPAIYRNSGGTLRRWAPGLGTADQDQTSALAMPMPGGGRQLVLGTFAYETSSPSRTAEVPAARRIAWGGGGTRITAEIPGQRSAAGPLAMADVDSDGDLDLFVGHRAYPAAYPIPASSRLFRNEGGEFVLDEAATSALQGIGLVTSALFVDLETDGDPDLVAAVEWGPIRIFRNEDGRFREVTADWGLDELTGWWNGLAAGDLNGDGRQDLVVTSWGSNTEYGHVSRKTRPLHLYFGLFDQNSSLDVTIARHDTAVGGPASLRGWEWLAPALPGVADRVGGFEEFSRMTVDELLGLPRQNVSRSTAVELRHLVLLNRGDSFEARPLPTSAQIAPAFGVAVAELDGDGREDVVLTQNFSGVPPGDGPYRAGRSLWLKGDGRGGFVAMPDSASMLRIYGDGRGLAVADYDGDGRTDVAVGQNRGPVRLFRNVRAEPGLRVRLQGPPGNPDAVGATVRLVYEDGSEGPAREIRAGSGYWSAHGPVPVLGLGGDPAAVRVRWPGGRESRVPVPAGARTVEARIPGSN